MKIRSPVFCNVANRHGCPRKIRRKNHVCKGLNGTFLKFCIASLCFSLWMKNIDNWKTKRSGSSRITQHRNRNLVNPTKPPPPAALEVVILTTFSAASDEANQNGDISVSVITFSIFHNTQMMMILHDTHNSLGWSSQYGTVAYSNSIVLRRTRNRRYYGLLFLENAQWCAIYQNR